MKKNLIITGGLGFIGFNFIKYIINNNLPYNIINIDNQTYAARYCLDEKLDYLNKHNIKNYVIDISNSNELSKISDTIIQDNIDTIINFAAESHVDNSISNPEIFLKTNILGVMNLLEICKKYNLHFHQVSTDEVYGPVDPFNDNVIETFKYNPSSPYSSSKASADLIILSYVKTFNIKATISRCTNNFGPYQHPEKLIPKTISNILNDVEVPIYGDGKQIRNWLYVDDHCDGILKIINNEKSGEIYNIGSNTLISNIDVVNNILKILNKSKNLIKFVKDRPGHDFAYHLNCEKIKNELNWNESNTFEVYLNSTIEWYKQHENSNNR